MNDSVFAVVSGEYSDYQIHGYCTTRKLANKYCALKNKGDWWSSYRVEEVPCFDATGSKVERVWMVYLFEARKADGGWTIEVNRPYGGGRTTSDTKWKAPKIEESYGFLEIRVWLAKKDKKTAKKIAEDALYEWLAKKEGLR